ncbi:hypothetical protein EYV94_12080 [Puteibacter caeruleilacunae]|nr:hypothetical protein EYV94_12080 [Puteibacter caeruleilacunae]
MESLVTIISFVLLGGLIVSPFLVLKYLNRHCAKYKFITYLILGVISTATITLLFGWWCNLSDELLLSHLGYNFDAMTYTERYAKVLPENIIRVKELETSLMGIGWPLKAMITYLVYSPYIPVVYLISNFYHRNRTKQP